MAQRPAVQTPPSPAPVQAQPQAAPVLPMPDLLTVEKMVWSVMAAVDQANATGNYSVLRSLGAPDFQARNDVAALAATFQGLRTQRIDLSDTLIVTPRFDIGPVLVGGGLMRVRGIFPLRPNAIAFDLLFQPANGRWALFGIAVAPVAPVPPR